MDFSTSRAGKKSDSKRIKDAIEDGNCGHFGCCGARVHKGATVLNVDPGTYYAINFPAITTITTLVFHNWEDDTGTLGDNSDLAGLVVPGGTIFYGDVVQIDLTAAGEVCVLYKSC